MTDKILTAQIDDFMRTLTKDSRELRAVTIEEVAVPAPEPHEPTAVGPAEVGPVCSSSAEQPQTYLERRFAATSLSSRTLRVGAGLTRTIFDMDRAAFDAFAEQAHVGAHAPATHTPEPRPVGGTTGRARSWRR
jgi:hypothetical protein